MIYYTQLELHVSSYDGYDDLDAKSKSISTCNVQMVTESGNSIRGKVQS
jgi:hypothetical protein